jgi:hypothetical protein
MPKGNLRHKARKDNTWNRLKAVLFARSFTVDEKGKLYGRCPKCRGSSFIVSPRGWSFCTACDARFANHDELTDALVSIVTGGKRLANVKRERAKFFGGRRFPRGKITIVEGDPDVGKSLLSALTASKMTTGRPLLGDSRRKPGVVILLSYEDDAAATLRPRLEAAGADLHRTHVLCTPDEPLTLDSAGIRKLEEFVLLTRASLVIIDPLTAALPAKINTNSDIEVRSALKPLVSLAAKTGTAIVIVRHLRKSTDSSGAIYRGAGSVGIGAIARSVLLLARDPDDEERRILMSVKNNLTSRPPAAALRMVEINGVPRLEFVGETDHRADDFAGPPMPPEERGALAQAVELLKSALEPNGSTHPYDDVVLEARTAGISKITLYRAKARLRVRCTPVRAAGGKISGWLWALPPIAGTNSRKP